MSRFAEFVCDLSPLPRAGEGDPSGRVRGFGVGGSEGSHALPAGPYFFCSCKRSKQEKHALVPHFRFAKVPCAARLLRTGANATSVSRSRLAWPSWPRVPCAGCAARCGTKGLTSKATGSLRIAFCWGSLRSPQPTNAFDLPGSLRSRWPGGRAQGAREHDVRVRGLRDRDVALAPTPSTTSRPGTGEAGDDSGCAFFAYFLCTSKESKAPPARRANHQNEKAQSDSHNRRRPT